MACSVKWKEGTASSHLEQHDSSIPQHRKQPVGTSHRGTPEWYDTLLACISLVPLYPASYPLIGPSLLHVEETPTDKLQTIPETANTTSQSSRTQLVVNNLQSQALKLWYSAASSWKILLLKLYCCSRFVE